jgi:dCTP deaminase
MGQKMINHMGQEVDQLNDMEQHWDNRVRLPIDENGSMFHYLMAGGGVLPDRLIKERIKIEPFVEQCPSGVFSYGLGHYGYDMRIDYDFRVFTPVYGVVVDPKKMDPKAYVQIDARDNIDEDGHHFCVIPPNSFALGVSVEHFEIPREVLAICLGKSSYARCGIVVPMTPLEPEWRGRVTLEISNTTPLPAKIYANEGIAQVIFIKGVRLCETSYDDKKGKYQDQKVLTLPFVKKVATEK